MPSKSKKQRNFMILVEKCKKDGKCSSKAVEDAAKSMTFKEVRDFTSTDPESLPDHVKKRSSDIFKIFKKVCRFS